MIKSRAWQLADHGFEGRLDCDPRQLLQGALLDLAKCLDWRWTDLPAAAAQFWRSWQVHRHLADVVATLIRSHSDRHGDDRPLRAAMRWAFRAMLDYTREVEMATMTVVPAITPHAVNGVLRQP